VEMVSHKANKGMRWEMRLITEFFQWLVGNNREPIGMLKLGFFIWNMYGFT
jgi:hypothetical protein